MVIRPSAVAGLFYPGDPDRLRKQVSDLLANIATPIKVIPKALIAPHAGYVYSGRAAAAAFATLRDSAQTITRVVLIGPAHYVHVRGIAAPTVDAFETPLGRVPVDASALEPIADLPFVIQDRRPACSRARSRSGVAVPANSPGFLPSGAARGRRCDAARSRTCAAPAVGRAGDADRRQLRFIPLSRLRDCAAPGCRDCCCHRAWRLGQSGPQSGLWHAGL